MESHPLYLLPFDTSEHPVKISQARNGPWSHFIQRKGNFVADLSNAVDFALPVGTEVRAMREGMVLDYWLRSTCYYEGLDPAIGNNLPAMSTNFVVIKHDDETIALYSHLGCEALVNKRQRLRAGEIIALTGKSGWIAEIPHLHVQVNNSLRYPIKSLPVEFVNIPDPLEHQVLLKQGKIWFG